MSAWVLPDHLADVLPSEARHIEELRRDLLDTARSYGYELVIPPLLEHLESLLTGAGEALDLQTFKLVDQLSGRTMGLRADTTPQVARIDAHLLNRAGITRLCYCGPVLHTRADRPHASREPLQFGAEIHGHAGLEAEIESLHLALECLSGAGLQGLQVDLGDARVLRALLSGQSVSAEATARIQAALLSKDANELAALTQGLAPTARDGVRALLQLFGDVSVLEVARRVLPALPELTQALDDMAALAGALTGTQVSIDLADLRGYAYYSGPCFAVYAQGASASVARGGRYDEVGAVFGRNRPAVGFSLDIKDLVSAVPKRALKAAIRAPWRDDAALRTAIAGLRRAGETVVCVLPGHEHEIDEFDCDRQLELLGGRWQPVPLTRS